MALTSEEIMQVWRDYRETGDVKYRNILVERYLPLVRYNAERIWARLPEGVESDPSDRSHPQHAVAARDLILRSEQR